MRVPFIKLDPRSRTVTFGLKAAPFPKPNLNDPSLWGGMPFWGYDKNATYDDPHSQVMQYKGYIYACVWYNMRAVARQTMRLYTTKTRASATATGGTRAVSKQARAFLETKANLMPWTSKEQEIQELAEHQFHDVMRNVNPQLNRAELWMRTEMFMGTTGNCYWWWRRNAAGDPYQIWMLESQNTKPVIGETVDDYVKGYVNVVGTQRIPFDVDEILHHRYPSPYSSVVGMSPIINMADPTAISDSIYKYERAVFRNMARPDGVLETPDQLGDDAFNRLKREWTEIYGGVNKAGQVAVLESGVQYKPVSFKPRDLAYIEGRKLTRDDIASGYGVPLPLLTPDNSNKSVSQTAYAQYMRDTVAPKLTLYEEKINEMLPVLYGDDRIFCAFDDCVPEDIEQKIKARESRLRTAYSTVNQERVAAGDEPHEGWGDMPIIANNMSELMPMTMSGGGGGGDGGKNTDPEKLAEAVLKRIYGEQG